MTFSISAMVSARDSHIKPDIDLAFLSTIFKLYRGGQFNINFNENVVY